MRGDLHLIERLDQVTRLPDGRWISGYWELTEGERAAVRRVFLHKTKADRSHFGGGVSDILPAVNFSELAAGHKTDPAGRWVLVVVPDQQCKDAAWEGADYAMAYKALV